MLSITYFVAVAENLSFTVAARYLYVSQPTISKRVAELEAELGLLLFYRSGKSIQLTAAGRQLYFDFKTLLQFFDEITMHAKDISSSTTGTVHIGVPRNMDLSRSIPGFIKHFYTNNLGIKIILQGQTRRNMLDDFLEEHNDCSFFLSFDAEHLQNELPIEKFDLPKGPHRLLYSPALFPAGYQPTIDSFRETTFFFFKDINNDYSVSGKSSELLSKIGFKPKNSQWVDSHDVLLLYVTEGIGVTIVGPSYRVEESERLKWIPVQNEDPMVGLCLCWKRDLSNPAALFFINAVKAWCKNPSSDPSEQGGPFEGVYKPCFIE